MKWRAGILYKDGSRKAENFDSKGQAENWVLSIAEKEDIKTSMIVNRKNISERYIEHWEEKGLN